MNAIGINAINWNKNARCATRPTFLYNFAPYAWVASASIPELTPTIIFETNKLRKKTQFAHAERKSPPRLPWK
jgi:hypothetical protein